MNVFGALLITLMFMFLLIAFAACLYMLIHIVGYTSVAIENITGKENKISKLFKKISDI